MGSYYTVSTSGHGLVVREVRYTDTTLYADAIINSFDTWEEAEAFATAHDSEYYWDYWEEQ